MIMVKKLKVLLLNDGVVETGEATELRGEGGQLIVGG